MKPIEANLQQQMESLHPIDLHPSVQAVVTSANLKPEELTIALKTLDDRPEISAREQVMLTDGEQQQLWVVPSLRALFRGDRKPPSMQPQPPDAYMSLFYFIEQHAVLFAESFGNPTDGEFRDAFSNLRRRPDGKSTSPLHFFLWQVAAGLLGTRVISAAEFEAIFTRLTQSASTFQDGLVSRNYIETLRLH